MIKILCLDFWGPALDGDTSHDDRQDRKPAPLACALLCQYHSVGCTVVCTRRWNWIKKIYLSHGYFEVSSVLCHPAAPSAGATHAGRILQPVAGVEAAKRASLQSQLLLPRKLMC